ncbi:hypothetical protein GQ53DRAFT_748056 [Thozetella sp. PMI_491]|nr:hypothetical protein GQ53DRAFT_748056 [Thozetella sp. PMI_491]
MKIPNPLPYDPRPSKAHPEHRSLRKKMEKEHPFNWLPIGVLALMGVSLAMNIEKDVKKCEEKKEKQREERDDDEPRSARGGQRRRRDDRDRRWGQIDSEREMGRDRGRDRSWERTSRAGDRRSYRRDCSCDGRSCDGRSCDGRSCDGRSCAEFDYDYRPRRSLEYRR